MPKPKHYVAVYELDRHYGGPEEGGWWYDTGRLVYMEQCFTDGWAYKRAEQLYDKYPDNGNRGTTQYHRMSKDYEIRVVGEDDTTEKFGEGWVENGKPVLNWSDYAPWE